MPPLGKPTDEYVMREVADGNLDSLKILFERYHRHIYAYVLKMCGDRMLSEDITQEVFYRIMKYRNTYNDGNFQSWLFTISRNSLKAHFIRKKETYVGLESAPEQISEEPYRERNTAADIHWALNRMEPGDRELLVLHRMQGMAYADIAEILGSTTGAVKTKACRALKKLRQLYFETHGA